MRIALCAFAKEETSPLMACSIAAYVHATLRRMEVAAFFFPLHSFEVLEGKTLSSLLRIAKKNRIVLGVGLRQNKGDVYVICFPEGVVQWVDSSTTLELDGHLFSLGIGINNIPEPAPRILFGDTSCQVEEAQKLSPKEGETYFLGPCEEGVYEAFVFEHGEVKCSLPMANGNILVKSVPFS